MLTCKELTLPDGMEQMTGILRPLLEAEKTFKRTFDGIFKDHLTLDPHHFNSVCDALKHCIVKAKNNDVEVAINELCRQVVCNQTVLVANGLKVGLTFEDLFGFAKLWNYYVDLAKIGFEQRGVDMRLGRSDDGYGDLCDALPLAGKEFIERIVAQDILSDKQLEKGVTEVLTGTFFVGTVLHGENYFSMRLEEGLFKWTRIAVRGLDAVHGLDDELPND